MAHHVHVAADPVDLAGRFVADDLDEGDLVLQISGIVPAVDFHPFVVQSARKLGLRGWIRHDNSGALIRAVGPEGLLVRLVRAIRDDAPSSARVRSMDPAAVTPDLPPVSERFTALLEEPIDLPRPPEAPKPLANVA